MQMWSIINSDRLSTSEGLRAAPVEKGRSGMCLQAHWHHISTVTTLHWIVGLCRIINMQGEWVWDYRGQLRIYPSNSWYQDWSKRKSDNWKSSSFPLQCSSKSLLTQNSLRNLHASDPSGKTWSHQPGRTVWPCFPYTQWPRSRCFRLSSPAKQS